MNYTDIKTWTIYYVNQYQGQQPQCTVTKFITHRVLKSVEPAASKMLFGCQSMLLIKWDLHVYYLSHM